MKREEKKYYDTIKAALSEQGTYSAADDITIEQAAAILHQIDLARKELDKSGHVQEFSTGARQISAELVAWRGLMSDFAKYADMLGLSPKARKRLGVVIEKPKKENPFKLRKVKS